MENNKALKIAGITLGAAGLGFLIYKLFLSSSSDEENFEAEFDSLIAKAKAECQSLKDKKSLTQDNNFTEEFTLIVFKVLSKYATLAKKNYTEEAFQNRIEFLKNDEHEKYQQAVIEAEKIEMGRITQVKEVVMRELKIAEIQYVQAFKIYSQSKPEFA